jgi:hypothetical protein
VIELGALTTGVVAGVDPLGTLVGGGLTLTWRVRDGDRWLIPGDVAVHQVRPGVAPVAETALRVSGGEVVHRAYAVSENGGAVVVEVENASPGAIAVAFSARGSSQWELVLPGRPGAEEPDGALVFPVPHRQRSRVALSATQLEVRELPDADAVERAWATLLDRGMTTELPQPLQQEIDAARADLLLARASSATFAALEAWGFDAEAEAMWHRLGFRARRLARRKAADGSGLLASTRATLVRETHSTIDILPGFRAEWLGQSIAAHDVPLRCGRGSFALRWHGARPALLWDVPSGTRVRAPLLDPLWSSTKASSEALLAPPPSTLLPLGHAGASDGAPIDTPDVFS